MNFTLPKVVRPPAKAWQQLVLRCANINCPGRHPVINGILHRGEGIHCNGSEWYCGPDCMEAAIARHFAELLLRPLRKPASPRIPLGLELVSRGLISGEQLREALQFQQQQGGLLGECLTELGYITEAQVTAAVASQWSCPVFPSGSAELACAPMLPRALQRSNEILPVHAAFTTGTLYIAFSKAVDYSVLYAIERMLKVKTEPCILSRSVLLTLLDKTPQPADHEVVMDLPLTSFEMARMVRGYAQQLRADALRHADCGNYLWVQVSGPRESIPLLFKLQRNLLG